MEFEAVIGLEVHAELLTNTKIFCSCASEFGGEPNTHCCPVCMGLPGALPVLNKKVLEYGIRAGLALNCSINKVSYMARKNYFYPDCPKNYQITQHETPLCSDGYIEIEIGDEIKKIGIERIHIEEDAGKAIHGEDGSYIDYNRAGVPLIEIVSNPDMTSPVEAREYLEKLKSILKYIEVSDCRMEEGSLRCDVNISIREEGSSELGVKTEIKNMNSFRNLEKAVEYEINRQIGILRSGGKISQETRRWDERSGKTVLMRAKEYAEDYRYFSEPDMLPISFSSDYIQDIKNTITELPHEIRKRFICEYGLSKYDADLVTREKGIAEFFQDCIECGGDPKDAANWIAGELLRYLKERNMDINEIKFKPSDLVELIELINRGIISSSMAKDIFKYMFDLGENPEKISRDKNLILLSDEGELIEIINKVIDENEQSLRDFKNGKSRAKTYLVGQIMKVTKGRANPKLINELLSEQLNKR